MKNEILKSRIPLGYLIHEVARLMKRRFEDEAQAHGITAIVLPQSMAFVLLGNSFLTRFQMQRTNDQLTLDRRF